MNKHDVTVVRHVLNACPISAADSIPNRINNVWQHVPRTTSLIFISPWFVVSRFKFTQVNMRQQQIFIPPSSSIFCRANRADRALDVGIPIIVGIVQFFTNSLFILFSKFLYYLRISIALLCDENVCWNCEIPILYWWIGIFRCKYLWKIFELDILCQN